MKETKFDEEMKSMDAMILEIAKAVSKNEAEKTVVVPEREELVKLAYEALRLIVSGEDVTISYELHTPYNSIGAVTVTGRDIEIKNTVVFAKVVEVASNFEVCPKIDGTVDMDFTFQGLARKEGR